MIFKKINFTSVMLNVFCHIDPPKAEKYLIYINLDSSLRLNASTAFRMTLNLTLVNLLF